MIFWFIANMVLDHIFYKHLYNEGFQELLCNFILPKDFVLCNQISQHLLTILTNVELELCLAYSWLKCNPITICSQSILSMFLLYFCLILRFVSYLWFLQKNKFLVNRKTVSFNSHIQCFKDMCKNSIMERKFGKKDTVMPF